MGNRVSLNCIDGGSTITKETTTKANVVSPPTSHHTESLPEIKVKTVPGQKSIKKDDNASKPKSSNNGQNIAKKRSNAAKPKPQRVTELTNNNTNKKKQQKNTRSGGSTSYSNNSGTRYHTNNIDYDTGTTCNTWESSSSNCDIVPAASGYSISSTSQEISPSASYSYSSYSGGSTSYSSGDYSGGGGSSSTDYGGSSSW
ncbi:hypothetical protein BGW41_007446 [Actinomortierella wolfii]|nr:hypothetical protein BGW41_007446 [Actinomortierella wolfii]